MTGEKLHDFQMEHDTQPPLLCAVYQSVSSCGFVYQSLYAMLNPNFGRQIISNWCCKFLTEQGLFIPETFSSNVAVPSRRKKKENRFMVILQFNNITVKITCNVSMMSTFLLYNKPDRVIKIKSIYVGKSNDHSNVSLERMKFTRDYGEIGCISLFFNLTVCAPLSL